jgi:hypothetical protein
MIQIPADHWLNNLAARPNSDELCATCEGGGWIMSSYQPNPPNFEVCPDCCNPEGHPSP